MQAPKILGKRRAKAPKQEEDPEETRKRELKNQRAALTNEINKIEKNKKFTKVRNPSRLELEKWAEK